MKYLNTKQMIESLSGKNKGFITKTANTQERKYGNVDIFEAFVDDANIQINFRDYYIEFFFDNNGNLIDKIGNGQGHKYEKSITACAVELLKNYRCN